MNEIATAFLLVLGGIFMLLAGVGVIRMPDVFMRAQAAAKAATLGAGCMLMAVAVHFGELTVTTRAVLIAAFILLTAPVSAHMIARAAHSVGTPLWDGTIIDELRRGSQPPEEPPADDVPERFPAASPPTEPGTPPPQESS